MAQLSFAGLFLFAQLFGAILSSQADPNIDFLAACPGYIVTNVQTRANGLVADLKLAGSPCDIYGTDLDDLVLLVTYETGELPKPETCA
jgi:alpha-glucosidase